MGMKCSRITSNIETNDSLPTICHEPSNLFIHNKKTQQDKISNQNLLSFQINKNG